MNDSLPDDVQLGLWQPQTREELWGDLWYWIWLTELSSSDKKRRSPLVWTIA